MGVAQRVSGGQMDQGNVDPKDFRVCDIRG